MSATKRLVLIHGFTERPDMWDDLITGIRDSSVTISTPSIPGHGSHPKIPNQHTADAYCAALLEQLPKDELPLILIGHSMGGYLMSRLVQMLPGRVLAIGFFHSKAGADSAEKIADRKRAIASAAQNKDLYLTTMLRNTLDEANCNRLSVALHSMIEQAKQDISTDCIRAAHEVMIDRSDNVNFLKGATFRVHYFLGRNDKSIPLEQLKSELRYLPNALVTIAENTGHMGQIECPQEAQRWMREVCGIE